jgi:hypothetical protein
MTHHKIQAITDLAGAGMTLQDQLRPLEQKSGLGRMLLGGHLLKPAIEVFGNAEIHCHTTIVTIWYLHSTRIEPPRRDDVFSPNWAVVGVRVPAPEAFKLDYENEVPNPPAAKRRP